MKKIYILSLLLMLSALVMAATVAHPVIIEIQEDDGAVPEEVFIQAWLTASPTEVITHETYDVYYHTDGYVHIQCGQFEEWDEGDILHVDLTALNGAQGAAEFTLNYDNFQFYSLPSDGIILTGGMDELTLTSEFSSGWNLWSFNVEVDSLTVGYVFNDLENLTKVKSITQSYDPDLDDTFNTLHELVYGYGYWVQVSAEESMDLTGDPIQSDIQIPLSSGWNLIAYLPQTADSVSHAYNDLIVADQLEKVKSITQSYDPGLAYQYNTLRFVEPGNGYWINVNVDVADFSYPEPLELTRDTESIKYAWTPVIYTNSTCAYAMINESYGQVGAFAGEECRGVTEINEGYVSLVINGEEQETVTFKLFQNGITTDLNTQITTAPGEDIFFEFNGVPAVTELRHAYPNPFNPETKISFNLAQNGKVNLSVYNIKGQKVEELIDENLESGEHQIVWNANGIASGVYFVRLHTARTTQNHKVILMK